MNRDWHYKHKMPEKATTNERIQWHLEHAKNCACRPIPEGLLAKMNVQEKQKAANKLSAPVR
jgi:hypothetical protein